MRWGLLALVLLANSVSAFTTFDELIAIREQLEQSANGGDTDELLAAVHERLDWIDSHDVAFYIVVNVAAQELQVISNDQSIFHKRVVVGREGMETPELEDEIESIVFNPVWNVPPDLAADMLPKMQEQGGWPGYRIYVDGQMVDDIGQVDINSDYRIIQDAGSKNVLGSIKFNMPNQYGIYIHDTAQRNLFNLKHRAFSAGCVRLDGASELAAMLLDSEIDAIDSIIDEGTSMEVPLQTNVPVYVVNWSVYIDMYGNLQYGNN